MDPTNPVVQLCTQGMQAETEGRGDAARTLFEQAWAQAADDYERCIAAHYVARTQNTPEGRLEWNQRCLELADVVGDDRVAGFYASLHGNIGQAHLDLGDPARAREHLEVAVPHLDALPDGEYRDLLRGLIAGSLRTLREDVGSPDPPIVPPTPS